VSGGRRSEDERLMAPADAPSAGAQVPRVEHRRLALGRACQVTAVCSGAIGCLVLLGWVLDIAALKSFVPHETTLKPDGAVAALLAAGALLTAARCDSHPALRRGLALAVAAI